MKLDETDKKILENLTSDARLSARQIALKLDMSTVTVLSRMKKLENEKIITGYSALIDHERIGYDLTAIIEIIAKKDKLSKIQEKLSKIGNVCAVYDITGTTDTIVICKFKKREDLSNFVKEIASIPYIENTITNVALNTIKEDFRLT